MRQRARQVRDGLRAIAGTVRTGRKRQARALAADAAEDRVDEAGRALLALFAREVDGVVDGGGCGNAIEMEQLERGQPEDVEDLGVQLAGRPCGKRRDHDVERALPAQGAGCDFSRQRAIALVVQAGAGAGEGRGEIGASGAHRAQHVVGRLTGRRNHGDVSRTPGVTLCPLRNSRAVMTRRPSGWTCRRSIRSPSPAAIVSVSPPAGRQCPVRRTCSGVRLQPDLVRGVRLQPDRVGPASAEPRCRCFVAHAGFSRTAAVANALR